MSTGNNQHRDACVYTVKTPRISGGTNSKMGIFLEKVSGETLKLRGTYRLLFPIPKCHSYFSTPNIVLLCLNQL